MTVPDEQSKQRGHVCPAACACFLGGAYRRWFHDPDRILAGLIRPGETVVDLGCGPGYFGPALARAVGPTGRVILVDLQQTMLDFARRRMTAAGYDDRVTYHLCGSDRIGLDEPVDFAMAFYMVHEVPDQSAFLSQLWEILKPNGRFLLVEPKIHVSRTAFAVTLATATALGFELTFQPRIFFSRTALLSVAADHG